MWDPGDRGTLASPLGKGHDGRWVQEEVNNTWYSQPNAVPPESQTTEVGGGSNAVPPEWGGGGQMLCQHVPVTFIPDWRPGGLNWQVIRVWLG